MTKLIFVNIKVFFAFLFILFLVPPCVSDRNINNGGSTQQRQPQYLDQHENQQKEDHRSPSSSSQKGPRLIGLDVNGRLKSLLWNNPKTLMDSTRTPLFSSPCKHEDEEEHLWRVFPAKLYFRFPLRVHSHTDIDAIITPIINLKHTGRSSSHTFDGTILHGPKHRFCSYLYPLW